MPREQHLKVLNEMLAAAYDEGTLHFALGGTGPKERSLNVSFSLAQGHAHRLSPDTQAAFKRSFDLIHQVAV